MLYVQDGQSRYREDFVAALAAGCIAAATIERLITEAPGPELLDHVPLAVADFRRAHHYCEHVLSQLRRACWHATEGGQ
jgi:hypothetical protein